MLKLLGTGGSHEGLVETSPRQLVGSRASEDGALSPPGPCGDCAQFPSLQKAFFFFKKKSTYFDLSSSSFDLPGCRSARGARGLSPLQAHSLEQELRADLHLHRTLFQVTDSALQGEEWLAADGALRDQRRGETQRLFSLIQAPGRRRQRWDHPPWPRDCRQGSGQRGRAVGQGLLPPPAGPSPQPAVSLQTLHLGFCEQRCLRKARIY